MKLYTVEKINSSKFYLFLLFGLLCYVFLMILVISILTMIYPKFSNVNLVLVVTALVSTNYIYKFSFSKSSHSTEIKINEKKIVVGESEFLLDDIKNVKFKRVRLNYFPTLQIELINANRISFRIAKNDDFYKLIAGLEANAKICKVLSY